MHHHRPCCACSQGFQVHNMHVTAGWCRFIHAWLGGRLSHADSAVSPRVRGLGPSLGWSGPRVCQPLQLVQLAIHLLLHLKHLRTAAEDEFTQSCMLAH